MVSLLLREVLKKAAFFLRCRGKKSPRVDAELILSFLLGKERSFFYAHGDEVLPGSLVKKYWKLIRRRGAGEPMAYLVQQKEFMGISFYVEEGVLIPRPETEHLAEFVIKWLRANYPTAEDGAGLKVLDLGTGSGNIAISLACYLPALRVMALDLDEHVLKIAAINGRRHRVMDRLDFFCGSLQDLLKGGGHRFNAIVSNPPYIPAPLLSSLPPEVRNEPRIALDGGRNGLDVYREIFKDAHKCLFSPGLLALEIGKGQLGAVTALARQAGAWKEIITIKDYAGLERVCCFVL